MGKPALGVIAGSGLGLLDGVSALLNPAAQSMLVFIIISATIKGAVTGAAVGFAARRVEGVLPNMAAGGIIGAVLSVLAAIPTGSYLQIIAPGVAIGVIAGLIVARFGR